MENYSNFTYDELFEKKSALAAEYVEEQTKCAKDGLSWEAACNKLRPVATEMYLIGKEMRLKKEPTMTFGKKWKGKLISIEEFSEMSRSGKINDTNNVGYYATETGQSDIEIYPSDVIDDKIRKDFYYVILYKK